MSAGNPAKKTSSPMPVSKAENHSSPAKKGKLLFENCKFWIILSNIFIILSFILTQMSSIIFASRNRIFQ